MDVRPRCTTTTVNRGAPTTAWDSAASTCRPKTASIRLARAAALFPSLPTGAMFLAHTLILEDQLKREVAAPDGAFALASPYPQLAASLSPARGETAASPDDS